MKQYIIRSLIVVLVVFCSCGFGYSQNTEKKDSVKRRWVSEISFGYNSYGAKNDYFQAYGSGLTVGYGLEKQINAKLFFFVSADMRMTFSEEIVSGNTLLRLSNFSPFSLSIYFPFWFRINVYKSKLFFTSGLSASFNQNRSCVEYVPSMYPPVS